MNASLLEQLKGINAINITPFDEHQDIDYPALGRNLDFLIAGGIKMIYPCGNTGEFYSLSRDEMKEVVRYTAEYTKGRAHAIAGIGFDTATAIELAKHAEAVGAAGVMIHQPVNPFMLEDGLVEYYQKIARATSLPVLLYVRSPQITADVLEAVAKEPNIVGVKYAYNDLPAFTEAVEQVGDQVVWICGTAELWAPYYFAAGAEGFTSGMVNVDTKRSFAMLEALQAGNFKQAFSIWKELRLFEKLRAGNRDGNNVSVVKEAMHQLGLGNGIVRPPVAQLKPEEKAQVRQVLISWGLLEG